MSVKSLGVIAQLMAEPGLEDFIEKGVYPVNPSQHLVDGSLVRRVVECLEFPVDIAGTGLMNIQ